jgi:hypothetical protein
MAARLGDNPGKPCIRELRTGRSVAGRALRRTPSAAEEGPRQRRREQLVEPWVLLPAYSGGEVGMRQNLGDRRITGTSGFELDEDYRA